MKEKTIETINDKGYYHGYQEWYSSGGNKLWLRGMYKNGEPLGYCKNNPDFGGVGDEGTVIEFYIQ